MTCRGGDRHALIAELLDECPRFVICEDRPDARSHQGRSAREGRERDKLFPEHALDVRGGFQSNALRFRADVFQRRDDGIAKAGDEAHIYAGFGKARSNAAANST